MKKSLFALVVFLVLSCSTFAGDLPSDSDVAAVQNILNSIPYVYTSTGIMPGNVSGVPIGDVIARAAQDAKSNDLVRKVESLSALNQIAPIISGKPSDPKVDEVIDELKAALSK